MRVRLIGLAIALMVVPAGAQRRDLQKPLVLASQGSFFVGGDTKKAVPAAATAGCRW